MKTPLLALALTLALALPVTLADPLIPLPCTEAPIVCTTLEGTGVTILGDTIIGYGETETYDGKTVVAQGSVTVEDGGTFELLNSSLLFSAGSNGFSIEGGGTLRIINSSLTDVNGERRLVIAAPGATVEITTASVIDGFTVHIATNATTIHTSQFQNGNPALVLDNVTFMVNDSRFFDNDVSVNITEGSPTLLANTFDGGTTHVQVWKSSPTVSENIMTGSDFGISTRQSGGVYQANSMKDHVRPPSHGGEFFDCSSTPVVQSNSFQDWGTAVFGINCGGLSAANVLADNSFSGNLVNTNIT